METSRAISRLRGQLVWRVARARCRIVRGKRHQSGRRKPTHAIRTLFLAGRQLEPQAANDVREEVQGHLQDATAALPPPCAPALGGPRLIEDGRVVRLIILGLSVRPAGGQSPSAEPPGLNWNVTANSAARSRRSDTSRTRRARRSAVALARSYACRAAYLSRRAWARSSRASSRTRSAASNRSLAASKASSARLLAVWASASASSAVASLRRRSASSRIASRRSRAPSAT